MADPTLTDEELAEMERKVALSRERVEGHRVDRNIHPNVFAADLDVLLPACLRLIVALRSSRAEVEAMMDDRLDLEGRLREAGVALAILAFDNAASPGNWSRLMGKAEGVLLAVSYLP